MNAGAAATSALGTLPVPGADEILFVPLGGAGEIGMNVALYGHAGAWLMVDLGITFGDDSTPGVEVIVPDIAAAAGLRDRLVGLVVTHAHEDHVGAVPFLWERLGCPVYATPFTAAFLRRKLADEGVSGEVPIREIAVGSRFRIGPFDLQSIPVAHSIPESSALAIRTEIGTVLHSGDWKLDPDPVVGRKTDEDAFRALGEEGVLAMVSDSTNAMVPGRTGSEGALLDSLSGLIERCAERVVFTCFASNVARLHTIATAAAANGRDVALVGRSLHRMDSIARSVGYLDDVPSFLGEDHVGFLPRDKTLLVCTGSQGEPRAAMWRIAAGDHPNVVLDAGDTAVFSARVIPGNERSIGRLQDQILRSGLDLVTSRDHFVHVSGHPARDELKEMYGWVRPRFVVPVHGELRHMRANATVALECGVEEAVVGEDGTILRITVSGIEPTGSVPVGRLARDGRRLVAIGGSMLRERQRMLTEGAAVATIVIGGNGRLVAPPQVTVKGMADIEEAKGLLGELEDVVFAAVERLPAGVRRDDEAVREAARVAVRRHLRSRYGKRPMTDVHLVRLDH